MNICKPFIHRPIATGLLAAGLLLAGLASYHQLPVASLPSVDLPTIRVNATWPGADPDTMASGVAAPLERQLGAISGVNEITSTSSLGVTSITVQFDIKRKVDKAAQDVQAAINAAMTDLPSDLPSPPTFRKANPASAPILILALTSRTLATSEIYDAADTVLVQRLSQVKGVGEVTASGADQPAIRIEVNPARIAAAGFTLEQIRTAVVNSNTLGPLGAFEGPRQSENIRLNAQIAQADAYRSLALKSANGTVMRLTDIAEVSQGVRNIRASGSYDGKPAVLLTITKAANANIIETVSRIQALLPELKRWIPADIDIDVMSDRTLTLNASIADMQKTLLMSIGMVVGIVFLFLGRGVSTFAAAITIPLSFAGAFLGMWVAGFTIDNLSLMALAIAVGFVVDDAIVVIESIIRQIEAGVPPFEAAVAASGHIAPTVLTISLSLIAAFTPLFFMGGVVGKFMLEFSMTVAFAVAASTLVALSVTPMICGRLLRPVSTAGEEGLISRYMRRLMDRLTHAYLSSLRSSLRFGPIFLIITLGAIGSTVYLFTSMPKGYFPQDDTGQMNGWTEAAPDISFEAMRQLQDAAAAAISADPAVAHVGSFIGASGSSYGSNSGRLYVSLKPLAERKLSARRVIARLRTSFAKIAGIHVVLFPVQDVRGGGRQAKSELEFALWSSDLAELRSWAPKVEERLRRIPGLTDVSADLDEGSLQVDLIIDRDAAARMGVTIASIDAALNNAFSQRQIVTLFSERNQYRVVMASSSRDYRDPSAIDRVFVTNSGGKQVALASLVRRETKRGPISVSHQGQYPSATVSYGLAPGTSIGVATTSVRAAVNELMLPETLHADFAGDSAAFARSADNQPFIILAALVGIYILLGILYESFTHPLTILSTLPSAALGALLALKWWELDVTVVAMIGIILLIGIVKKNGIMLVDRALDAQNLGQSAEEAILTAARDRFRPILMTTMAAILGALPLLLADGPGAELRRPLGVTIIGGLFVSQVLTLYTTPAVFLGLEWLRTRVSGLFRGTRSADRSRRSGS